jgi:8-oxo-dGTP pyrophosphatase MutT (NUDIX family)
MAEIEKISFPKHQGRSYTALMEPKILGQGRWLSLQEIQFLDSEGKVRSWECVRRQGGRGAASMVATVEKMGEPHVILVKQFRPPVNGFVIELPAGLIDAEEGAESTAKRELAEETGWRGEAIEVGPFVLNSPGLSDERTALVRIEASREEKTNFDGAENIEVLVVPLRGLKKRLLEEEKNGAHLDGKLWCFALGMEMGGG